MRLDIGQGQPVSVGRRCVYGFVPLIYFVTVAACSLNIDWFQQRKGQVT